ncbi:hypothetical protein ECANGB1_1131 [Enterospora canceri]|uniref:Uncharacterized protein n=1 Tax=Enterospora canceri TaxID=1081671 RepID=A0A1Y1S6P1_9MICR|nr:hypothetical protein ECANGB1_1131 [Enterospora canceri]
MNDVFKKVKDALERCKGNHEVYLSYRDCKGLDLKELLAGFRECLGSICVENRDSLIKAYDATKMLTEMLNRAFFDKYEHVWYKQMKNSVFDIEQYKAIETFIEKDYEKYKAELYENLKGDRNKTHLEIAETLFKKDDLINKADEEHLFRPEMEYNAQVRFIKEYFKNEYFKLEVFYNKLINKRKPTTEELENLEKETILELSCGRVLSRYIMNEQSKILAIKIKAVELARNDFEKMVHLLLDAQCFAKKLCMSLHLDPPTAFIQLIDQKIVAENICKFIQMKIEGKLDTKAVEKRLAKKYTAYKEKLIKDLVNGNQEKLKMSEEIDRFHGYLCTKVESKELQYKILRYAGIEEYKRVDFKTIEEDLSKITTAKEILENHLNRTYWQEELDSSEINEGDLEPLRELAFKKEATLQINKVSLNKKREGSDDNRGLFLFRLLSKVMRNATDKEMYTKMLIFGLVKNMFKNGYTEDDYLKFLACCSEHQKHKLIRVMVEFKNKDENSKYFQHMNEKDVKQKQAENEIRIQNNEIRDALIKKYRLLPINIKDRCSIGSSLMLNNSIFDELRNKKVENSKRLKGPTKSILLMKKCYWPVFVNTQVELANLPKIKKEVADNLKIDNIAIQFNDLMSKVTVKINGDEMHLNLAQFELIQKLLDKKECKVSDNVFVRKQINILKKNKIVEVGKETIKLIKIKAGDFTLKSSYIAGDMEEIKDDTDLYDISIRSVLMAKITAILKRKKSVELSEIEKMDEMTLVNSVVKQLVEKEYAEIDGNNLKYVA